MKKALFLASCMLVASMAQAQEVTPPPQAGVCFACHGQSGKSVMPIYPNLAGQNEQYIINTLHDFKAGKRQGTNSQLMIPIAQSLSDADIQAVAKYFSSLK